MTKYATHTEREAARRQQRPAIALRYRERHKEALAAKARAYQKRKPEVYREAAVRHYWKNRSRILAKKYGVSEDELMALGDACAICGSQESLCIDHCHSTGRVRGVLCQSCNHGIGFLKDDPAMLLKAIDYLVADKLVPLAPEAPTAAPAHNAAVDPDVAALMPEGAPEGAYTD